MVDRTYHEESLALQPMNDDSKRILLEVRSVLSYENRLDQKSSSPARNLVPVSMVGCTNDGAKLIYSCVFRIEEKLALLVDPTTAGEDLLPDLSFPTNII